VHESVIAFVRSHRERIKAPVLEVGSYNVNGSVRSLCPTPYLGVDIVDGPGVDAVIDAYKPLPFESGSFATVISTEMLEHALAPTESLAEMVRVLAPDGLLLVTARGNGFPHHNPPDRWRFMPGTLAALAQRLGLEAVETTDPQVPGVFVVAMKLG
jgi:SAM-dependent methyltransferase